jgi:hypothetical protein
MCTPVLEPYIYPIIICIQTAKIYAVKADWSDPVGFFYIQRIQPSLHSRLPHAGSYSTNNQIAGREVATMDDSKKQLLKDIFWQMNEISSRASTQTETIIETSDDGNGNIVETEVTVTRTYLYITVSHKTAEEMANQFSFREDQREQMAELLADGNNSLWS